MDASTPVAGEPLALPTRETIFLLLVELNLNISKFTLQGGEVTDEKMEKVITKATSILSGNVEIRDAKVEIKESLNYLWAQFGPPQGGKKPYPLYLYGAFTRTLPGLENPELGYPGMLRRVSEEITKQQLRNLSDKSEEWKRRKKKACGKRWFHPVICRCGFTHDILFIHCEQCLSWQHAVCYFDTHDKDWTIQKHICDRCLGPSPNNPKPTPSDLEASTLLRPVAELQISRNEEQICTAPTKKAEDSNDMAGTQDLNNYLGPFAAPRDDEFSWGPDNEYVKDTMESSLFQIRNVVYSMREAGLSTEKIKTAISKDNEWNLKELIEETHGVTFQENFAQATSENTSTSTEDLHMLCALISGIMVKSAFYEGTDSTSVSELLLGEFCKNILQTNGPTILRHLRRKSLLCMLNTSNTGYEDFMEQVSTTIVDKMMKLLLNMMKSTSKLVDGPLSGAELVDRWRKSLKQVSRLYLRMKVRLALAERYFELHFPHIGCVSSASLMVGEFGQEIALNNRVEVCLIPAVVEYIPEYCGKELTDLLLKPIGGIFVRHPPNKWVEGKVISPAIVVLRN